METEKTAAPAFDVTAYELADTAVLTLRNLDRSDVLIGADGKPAQVVVYSPGSPQGVRTQARFDRLGQLRMYRHMRNETQDETLEIAREKAERLTGYTKEFLNFPIERAAVFSNPKLIDIHQQVDDFIAKKANFSKGSSPN